MMGQQVPTGVRNLDETGGVVVGVTVTIIRRRRRMRRDGVCRLIIRGMGWQKQRQTSKGRLAHLDQFVVLVDGAGVVVVGGGACLLQRLLYLGSL